jgi:hypothetical protein
MRISRLGSMALALAVGFFDLGPVGAQEAAKPAESAVESLTPEELAEREARKACKVTICAAFRLKQAEGPDITCSVLKSWRKEQLQKMIERAKVSWPSGKVKCVADIRLKRADLVKAMSEASYVAALDKHQVNCEIEREKDGPAKISFAFAPKVTFENGKATKASLNWGAIEAPTLVKGAMWTATATDNTFNVLQSTLVEDINGFIGPKCDEVKEEWDRK